MTDAPLHYDFIMKFFMAPSATRVHRPSVLGHLMDLAPLSWF